MPEKFLTKTALGALVAAGALAFAAGASAKTLVYCSEGSPEGFNPALYTAGTTFDASSRNVFNRLVEFERGTTKIGPALAESWEVSDDGKTYTFKLRQGRQVSHHQGLHADARLQRRRRDLQLRAPTRREPPVPQGLRRPVRVLRGHGHGRPDQLDRQVDDYTVRFNLTKPEAPFIANLGMDFASIMSAEQADA